MRKEYRGQRSVDAFTNFVRNEMKPSVREFHSKEDFTPDVGAIVFYSSKNIYLKIMQ